MFIAFHHEPCLSHGLRRVARGEVSSSSDWEESCSDLTGSKRRETMKLEAREVEE